MKRRKNEEVNVELKEFRENEKVASQFINDMKIEISALRHYKREREEIAGK